MAYDTPRGPVPVLRDIDLEIAPGQVMGLVGESGSGKSSLAAAIMRLAAANARITAGSIRFEGEDLVGLGEGAMARLRGARLAMVFQDPMTALNPVKSIRSLMRDVQRRAAISRAERDARAVGMLRKVGIPDPDRRIRGYAHQFSGGMRQRVCIAMALLSRPALLIADEPTTALDVTMEAQILHLLKTLREDIGCAILFVSHNLGTVAEMSDHVAVMYAGEIVEAGPVEAIFDAPRHPYTRRLIDCDPARIEGLARRLPTIPGQVPDLGDLPPGCVFAPRCSDRLDRCTALRPAEQVVGAGHRVRCHLAGAAP